MTRWYGSDGSLLTDDEVGEAIAFWEASRTGLPCSFREGKRGACHVPATHAYHRPCGTLETPDGFHGTLPCHPFAPAAPADAEAP